MARGGPGAARRDDPSSRVHLPRLPEGAPVSWGARARRPWGRPLPTRMPHGPARRVKVPKLIGLVPGVSFPAQTYLGRAEASLGVKNRIEWHRQAMTSPILGPAD